MSLSFYVCCSLRILTSPLRTILFFSIVQYSLLPLAPNIPTPEETAIDVVRTSRRTSPRGAARRHIVISIGSRSLLKQPRRMVPCSPHQLHVRCTSSLSVVIQYNRIISTSNDIPNESISWHFFYQSISQLICFFFLLIFTDSSIFGTIRVRVFFSYRTMHPAKLINVVSNAYFLRLIEARARCCT